MRQTALKVLSQPFDVEGSPTEFIAVAEDGGLIGQLDDIVLPLTTLRLTSRHNIFQRDSSIEWNAGLNPRACPPRWWSFLYTLKHS